ncbi:hypothetical protein LU298_04060, partial [Komagataeibacter intermedius]|nr:hypothetical protein [Komagataeibacter intermedius]
IAEPDQKYSARRQSPGAYLEADITTFIDAHNKNPRPYRWVKSADQILASVKRFCHKTMSRTSDSGD